MHKHGSLCLFRKYSKSIRLEFRTGNIYHPVMMESFSEDIKFCSKEKEKEKDVKLYLIYYTIL